MNGRRTITGRGVSRREVLKTLLIAGAAPMLSRLPAHGQPGPESSAVFFEGVMAGDPQRNGCVIWTRVAPPLDGSNVPVLWSVAEDAAFTQIVAAGTRTASAAADHTVKLRVHRLDPDRWYFYRFEADGVASRIGRLRTAPDRGSLSPLRYAFASCQQRNDSFYVAHRAIAEENVDFLLHLGDYIYVHDFADLTLDDYRRRWKIFKSNPMLQDLQAQVPLVAMWDDGEFYNGVDRTGDPARLAAAKDAFFETMPIFPGRQRRCYRALRWGDLADVLVIDVRSYRDPEVPPNTDYGFAQGQDSRIPPSDQMFAEGRTTLGPQQKRWLKQGLRRRRSTWKLVGSGYNVTPLKIIDLDTPELRQQNPNLRHNEGIYVSNEAFDDYQLERRELLTHIAERNIRNVVFTSGHTHVYFASELQPDFDDPSSPTVAFDFTTGSLTADPPASEIAPIEVLEAVHTLLKNANAPSLKEVNIINQGYALVDCNPDEVVVTFRSIDTFDIDAEPQTFAQFRVVNGGTQMERLV
jgi:alkaline phosphatase D